MARGARYLLVVLLGTAAACPGVNAAANDRPTVVFDTTMGTLRMELFDKDAPRAVENFLQLVDNGFYDGLIFHRVIANFVIQTGGYDAEMTYRRPPRTVVNESGNGLKNTRGTLSMARSADPDSADAQFYINMNDNTHLDYARGKPGYTVFGRLIDGMDVAEDIELSDTAIRRGMAGVPARSVIVTRATRE